MELDYREQKTLDAVQELYAEYARPVGAKAVSRFLNFRGVDCIRDTLQRLSDAGLITPTATGIWRPAEASEDDQASVRKVLVQDQVKLLEHALKTKPPEALKQYVSQWCEDMELHLV